MARIQVYEGGQVSPAQNNNERFQAQDFGPGIGRGVEQLGNTLGQAVEVADRIGQIHDEAAVKEQVNGINQWYAEAGYTGSNAYFEKKGKDALETRPMVEKGLSELVKAKRALLQNERQQYMFDQAVNPQMTDWQVAIAKHANTETLTYGANESASRAAMTAEMAGLTYLTNPEESEQHIGTMKAELASGLKLQGAGPEQIAAAQLKATSGVYHDVGMQIASSGPQGWDLAREFVKQHGGDMTTDTRQAILDKADIEQRSAEAEQRRIEAEQRRAEADARRDARDTATSAASNIDTGIPMKPDEYAAALSAARASGDQALVKRIEVGQFKNSLSLQHQNDTPYQLQQRVNDLNASIAKAGTDAKPEQVIERDHLTQLLGRSREQLKTNPMAWGAQHLGIEVPPLQLGNPDSVRQRMNVVATIAKRTGVPVSPLQPDEIAQAQGVIAHGTTQDKVGLALKLSAFGSMATDAAEQVTNNSGFINLIGLATHSNRGVAASRVNQIVTGYDVLKTKPKLIDKTMADQQFNQYVGSALQFLPKVSDGVKSNAQALMAAEANEHGWSEWNQADPRAFYRAVNSALGAYTKNGVQVGGLATFNGAVTILPENMTQPEFEDRISKSHGPEFRRAQNGEPVYANGQSPTATDIKKMQWVPSGDNIYRIGNGSEFLKTKDGHDYIIDVTKLHGFNDVLAEHGYVRR